VNALTERREIRLAGTGGQGMVLAGIILAEAAGRFEGRSVAQTQVYGPESRGGATRSDVIIDVVEIDYPKATAPEALLVMSADGWKRYGASVRRGGTVVYDRDLVTPGHAGSNQPTAAETRLVGLPLTAVARERVGRAIVANVVGLAALVAMTGVVSRGALEAAARRRAPRGSEELNVRAVAAGWDLVADAVGAAETRQ
jgi:2-oxoglutarate ferredoxin oxidoreductase subunit gamma